MTSAHAGGKEARALEGISNSHLHDGNPSYAAEYLRQALAMYRRIGAPAAQRVQETPPRARAAFHHPSPDQSRPAAKAIHRPLPPRH